MLLHPSMKFTCLRLLTLILIFSRGFCGYLGNFPPGCDEEAALQCEFEFLQCKLFNGPANDRETLCNCASIFYGECLRLAGVRST